MPLKRHLEREEHTVVTHKTPRAHFEQARTIGTGLSEQSAKAIVEENQQPELRQEWQGQPGQACSPKLINENVGITAAILKHFLYNWLVLTKDKLILS